MKKKSRPSTDAAPSEPVAVPVSRDPALAQAEPASTRLAPPRWLYYLLFTASGFAGLIYESIWSHYLKLFLGHAAYAQSLVLMIFMGGLALGSWLVARFGTGWRLPILWYAAVEALIGLLALAFHPSFVGVTGAFYDTILPAVGDPLAGALLKWGAAAGLMVPQAVLLGMTFPLLSAGLLRRYPENPGGSLAMLYFTNSAGAAVGVLASGFWLIGAVGLPGTLRVGALLNLALAAIVGLLVAADRDRAAPALAEVAREPAARRTAQVFLLAAFVTGLASFIYEIGWIRMLSLVLGSTTHSFELMLSAFITGLACGGLWIRRRIDGVAEPVRFAAWVQVLMGTVAVLSVPLYAQAFGWMAALTRAVSHAEEGYRLFTLASHAIALTVMLPATFLAGMTLPLFTRVMLREGAGERAIGQVYAANTLGGIAGVLFAVHVGLPLLGLKNLVAAGALLDVLLGLSLLAWLRPARSGAAAAVPLAGAAVLGIGAVCLVLAFGGLSPQVLASGVYRFGRPTLGEGVEMPFYRDGKTASVAVARYPGERYVIMTNGKPDASLRLQVQGDAQSDEGTMVLTGALPLAYASHPQTAAVIGLGSGITTAVVLTDPRLRAVDTIEIEPAMVEGARLFAPRVARAFDDPRSQIHIEDAKTFFPLHRQAYDIIIAEPSNPWVSGVASLFSDEFYGLVTRYLPDDGTFVQWLQLYEFNDDLAFSVLKALARHFDDFVIYNHENTDVIIVARKHGRLGPPDFVRLFASPTAAELAAVGFRSPADLVLRRTLFRAQVMAPVEESAAPANSDYFPYLDQHAGEARLRQQSAHFLDAATSAPLPLLEMLTGPPWGAGPVNVDMRFDRTVGLLSGSALYALLVRGEPLPPNVKLSEPLTAAAIAVQSVARGCGLAGAGEGFPGTLHLVAEAAVGNLAPGRAAELVKAAGGRCPALPPALASWYAVYDAVAARSAEAMVSAAQRAWEDTPATDDRRRAYLLGAMMLGELGRGQAGAAAGDWYRYRGAALYGGRPDRLPPWLGLLHQLAARGGTVASR